MAQQPMPVAPTEEEQRAAAEADEALDEMDEADVEMPEGETLSREEVEQQEDPFDDVEEVDLDLADIDVGTPVSERSSSGDDPFDDVDETSFEEDSSEFDGTDHGTDPFSMLEDEEEADEGAIAETINNGAARLAVVGLDDEFEVNGKPKTKDDLRGEFVEVFEDFRLGHYSAEVAQEYLLIDDEEISPVWGLTASMLLCTVMVIMLRPDGDELVGRVKTRVQESRT